ncbi:MAG: hypothetical protein KKE17_05995 [Proteobacteria bacterium]|nr:hypothetical protein [Pseudomonadota bacterium]MBU1709539.1 hypothetical protein [Pseudomonadota bacterium]
MKCIKNLVFIIIALGLCSGCAITKSYGPYMGKVVVKETEEPIEGAVVFMRFYTEGIYSVTDFADAVEVLTDANGEFNIKHRVFAFRPFQVWQPHSQTIIFKPGYGAFPRHRGTSISQWQDGEFPENQYVTIKLPKLKTREGRRDNLSNLYPGSAPPEAYRTLQSLEEIERKAVGLNP